MNYLAHLHTAEYCNSGLLGNLAADFIRGKPDGRFPEHVSRAIYLHRFVDGYIDALPQIKTCRQRFPSRLYRYSAIALDIFWDHMLAKHWDSFHSASLEAFVSKAEKQCRLDALKTQNLPDTYLSISDRMWREGWILSYRDPGTLDLVLGRMATRSHRMTPLASCAEILMDNYHALEIEFPAIYRQVLSAALAWQNGKYR